MNFQRHNEPLRTVKPKEKANTKEKFSGGNLFNKYTCISYIDNLSSSWLVQSSLTDLALNLVITDPPPGK